MQSNNFNHNPETIGIMLIVMIIIICVLTGCSSFPDVCQQGVPTVKACLSGQGTKGSLGFGPINIVNSKF